jgi:hypothetical protein
VTYRKVKNSGAGIACDRGGNDREELPSEISSIGILSAYMAKLERARKREEEGRRRVVVEIPSRWWW